MTNETDAVGGTPRPRDLNAALAALRFQRDETLSEHAEAALVGVESYAALTGIEGGIDVRIWHMLLSLRELCRAEGIDVDATWANVIEEEPAIFS